MSYFALTYDVVDDFNDRKMPYRPQHLQLAREANQRGELRLAGALGEPAGALLVFKADDRSTPEQFAKADPYVTNGLVKSWVVRPWNVVIGDAES
jgi:uncharacterized protein YciI